HLAFSSLAASGNVEIYAAQGFVPTPTHFQYKSEQFNDPHPTLVIPAPDAGVPIYVIAYGRTLTASPLVFTLTATTASFGVTGVSPAAIGNSGASTITITGGQL